MSKRDPVPFSSIVIVGSGVFGLSTALWLASRKRYANTKIIVIDKSPFPAPDGSSIDSSRIIRADYSDKIYADLAADAREIWKLRSSHAVAATTPPTGVLNQKRNLNSSDPTATELYAGVGEDGRYSESGLVLIASSNGDGAGYVKASYTNVKKVFDSDNKGTVEWLDGEKDIGRVLRTDGSGGPGATGYVNWNSGWADAEAAMVWTRKQCEKFPNIQFVTAEVENLLVSGNGETVKGVRLSNGETLTADLTILAAGAWTARLIDLNGRAVSTGQVIAYMRISEDEEKKYRDMPVCLNLTNGVFVIPPRNGVLKVARHAYGYVNTTKVLQNGKQVEVSLPLDETSQKARGVWIPADAEEDLRQGLRNIVPAVADHDFTSTRLCWYTDTPKGDFIISHHPKMKNLFIATGGSGHGFKFLPVLGSKIVDVLEGTAPDALREKWKWQSNVQENLVTNDGSRSGSQRMDLASLLLREDKSKL